MCYRRCALDERGLRNEISLGCSHGNMPTWTRKLSSRQLQCQGIYLLTNGPLYNTFKTFPSAIQLCAPLWKGALISSRHWPFHQQSWFLNWNSSFSLNCGRCPSGWASCITRFIDSSDGPIYHNEDIDYNACNGDFEIKNSCNCWNSLLYECY